jgi:REP element-mobilizing transposase RayT
MARPRSEEIVGGYYHVTARGNGRASIFLVEDDFSFFLAFLGRAVARFGWRCFSYCGMPNHYHLVLQLTRASLASGLKWLNGLHAQTFNERHGRTGHVFGGRYTVTFIESEEHLGRACRYVDCNPVRAGICSHPADWPWSSYRALAGLATVPPFLSVHRLYELMGVRGPDAYREFVEEALIENAQQDKGFDPLPR